MRRFDRCLGVLSAMAMAAAWSAAPGNAEQPDSLAPNPPGAQGAANSAPGTAATACSSPAHRQFDFWVGHWTVYRTDTDKRVATSLIEKLYDGCAIRENWMPEKGTVGGSLNVYRPKSGEWRQVWTDGGNEIHMYAGRWTGREMELEGEARDAGDQPRRVRMTFEPKGDGSVVQTGYAWSSKDKRWALDYQFSYRRAPAS